MTAEQVRNDLKEIRYYYSIKEDLDERLRIVQNETITKTVEKYNKIMKFACMKLYDLYTALYIKGETQKCFAIDKNITIWRVKDITKELVDFLVKNLD